MADAGQSWHVRDDGWRGFAACRRTGVDFFDEDQAEAAVAVCAGCPVLEPCRELALLELVPEGVWGGLTPRDRRVVAMRRRQQARAALTRRPASR